jgi:pyrroloquinoline quinone biosynthesis protein D
MTQAAQPDPGWCPALRPGVMLRHDKRRHTYVLVMPERAVVLNATAAVILSLSNGLRSVDDVVSAGRARYPEGFTPEDVAQFLAAVRAHGWLV